MLGENLVLCVFTWSSRQGSEVCTEVFYLNFFQRVSIALKSFKLCKPVTRTPTALVRSGCYNKMPPTEWLINNRKNFCHSSGSWNSEIMMPPWSGEGSLLGRRLLVASSHSRRELCGVSFMKVLISFMKVFLL